MRDTRRERKSQYVDQMMNKSREIVRTETASCVSIDDGSQSSGRI